jgi:hypothetical protein
MAEVAERVATKILCRALAATSSRVYAEIHQDGGSFKDTCGRIDLSYQDLRAVPWLALF